MRKTFRLEITVRKKARANFLVRRLGENYGWAICAACLIVLFCNSGLNTTGFAAYQPYLIKLGGLTNTQSSTLIMIRTFSSLFGMMVVDKLIDKLEAKRVVTIGMILCCLAGNGSVHVGIAAVLVLGIGLAVSSVSISVYAAGVATGEHYAQTVTRFQLGFNLGALLFGRVPGMIADRTGSYVGAYQIMTLIAAVSSSVLLFTYRRILREDREWARCKK